MKSLGDQFLEKMSGRIDKAKFANVAQKFAEDIKEGAKDRSQRGEGLRNAPYDNRYESTQAAKHGRTSPVTLRDSHDSMRGMKTNKTSRGAKVSGSRKLRLHDTGQAKGGKIRQLFPKVSNQVPEDAKNKLVKLITDILDGR